MNFLLSTSSNGANLSMIILIGVLLVFMVVMTLVSRKRQKTAETEYKQMQDGLKAGDLVQTIGGIVGRIIKTSECFDVKTLIIETGDKNKTTMEINVNAVAGLVVDTNKKTEVTTDSEPEIAEPTIQEPNLEMQTEQTKTEQPKKQSNKKSNKNK